MISRLDTFRRAAAGLVLAAAVASASLAAPALPRVASVTQCGDEYLFLLADRGQIASVSAGAVGPLARWPEKAQGLPRNRRNIEELLNQNVELVLLEPGGDRNFVNALKRVGIRTVMVPSATSYETKDIEEGLRRVGAAVGHAERAEPIIADMRSRIAQLEAQQPPMPRRPIALYARPEGGGAARGTFIDMTMQLGGFRNLQTLAGQKGWKKMSLEDVVLNPPDAFVISFFDTNRNSLQAVRGRNPLLGRFNAPVISAPGRLMVCASPANIEAAEQLQRARMASFPGGMAKVR